MDCKKALQEAGGNIEAAIDAMRKSGVAKAAKKAGRIAAEGKIIIRQNPDTREAVILEVNSETDFVAKDENFNSFTERVAECILDRQPGDIESLLALQINGHSIEEERQQLVTRIGENINIRRFRRMCPEGKLGLYLHAGRIGVLVDIKNGDESLAKDIAMHIAGNPTPPVCIHESEVSRDLIEKEREIYAAQAAESGKPPEIVDKMVAGKISKFIKEVTLLSQPFIKDTEQTVGNLVKAAGAEVKHFIRYEVGEGLEKRSDNFAEQVMAQARGA
jgi:elongation factor Ts